MGRERSLHRQMEGEPGAVDTIVADGSDQPGLRGTTLALTVEAPNKWKVVRKKEGRTLLTGF